MCTLSYSSFLLFLFGSSLCIALIPLHHERPSIPAHRQLVSYCVHLLTHDHTKELSIGFICLVIYHYFLIQEGCGFVHMVS